MTDKEDQYLRGDEIEQDPAAGGVEDAGDDATYPDSYTALDILSWAVSYTVEKLGS